MMRDAVRGGRPAGVTPHHAPADVGIYDHNAPRKEGTSSPTTEPNGWVLAWSWVGLGFILSRLKCKKVQKKCKKMQNYLHMSKKSSIFASDLGIVPIVTI